MAKSLDDVTTEELVRELEKREGVEAIVVPPHEKINVFEDVIGPAVVLKVID